MKKIGIVFGLILTIFILTACGDSKDKKELKKIVSDNNALTSDDKKVINGFTVLSKRTVDSGEVTIDWTSSDDKIAIIENYDNGQSGFDEKFVTIKRDNSVDKEIILKAVYKLNKASINKDYPLTVLRIPEGVVRITIKELRAIFDYSIPSGGETTPANVMIENAIITEASTQATYASDGTGTINLFGFNTNLSFAVGTKGTIIAKTDNYFKFVQLKEVTFSKVNFNEEIKPIETTISNISVSHMTDPEVLEAKKDAKYINYFKFKANIVQKNFPGSTTQYSYFLEDPSDSSKFVLSYYKGSKHTELTRYVGVQNVTIIATTAEIRDIETGVGKPMLRISVTEIILEAPLTDAQKVTAAKTDLNIASAIKEGKLALPAKGLFETTITWAYADAVNNDLIDLTTGQTNPTPGQQKEVKLIATITSGSESDTKPFTVKVGEVPLSTIKDVKTLADTTPIKVRGVVTSFVAVGTSTNIYIQDDTAGVDSGIFISFAKNSLIGTVAVNDLVEIEGLMATFGGARQIATVSAYKKVGTGTFAAFLITSTTIPVADNVGKMGKAVGILDFVAAPVANARYEFSIDLGDGKKITVSVNKNYVTEGFVTEFNKLAKGDKVEVNSGISWYSNNPQLDFFGTSQIKKVA